MNYFETEKIEKSFPPLNLDVLFDAKISRVEKVRSATVRRRTPEICQSSVKLEKIAAA